MIRLASIFTGDGRTFLGTANLVAVCGEDFCDNCGCCLACGDDCNLCPDGCYFVVYAEADALERRFGSLPQSEAA